MEPMQLLSDQSRGEALPGRPLISDARRPKKRKDLSPNLGAAEREYCYSVAMRYMRNASDADDVTQDAMLVAYRRKSTFRGKSRYSTWLYRVVSTTALMHLRKDRRVRRYIDHLQDAQQIYDCTPEPDGRPNPETRLARLQTIDAVLERLEELGYKYESVFWNQFFDGCNEKETAERMHVPRSTIKSRTHRLRIAVRDLCTDHVV